MKQTTLAVGCVLGLVSVIAGWREYHHGQLSRAWTEETGVLRESRQVLEEKLAGMTALADTCSADRTSMRRDLETLRDRCTNLTAQRDHLKAESNRQMAVAGETAKALEQKERELQANRQELLVMAAAPQELESGLAQARARIQELELLLDEQSALFSKQPVLHSVDGISTDGTVVALSGDAGLPGDLPCPIRLCRRNEQLLEGWINRIEEGSLVIHAGHWEVPPSALVKGEKVFILPDRSHESDP